MAASFNVFTDGGNEGKRLLLALIGGMGVMGGLGFLFKDVQAVFKNLHPQGKTLSAEDAEMVAYLANKYPRIAEACVRWAAGNEAGLLSSKEFKVINKTHKRIRSLGLALEDAQKANDALNAYGLADKISVEHQATTLSNTSPPAPATRSPRRI